MSQHPPTGPGLPHQPPMPGQPWPPGYGAPPPKKKNTVLIVLLSVLGAFVLLCGGCGILAVAAGSGSSESGGDVTAEAEAGAGADDSPEANAPTAAAPTARPAQVARIGTRVRDGKFEFVVRRVRCGVEQIGSRDFGSRAQGQFCLVTVTVKNIGKEPQTLSDDAQKAYVGAAEYATDSSAAMDANRDNDIGGVWYNEINPGNQVTGILVWDIPAGKKLTKLELHDSVWSDGVEVRP